MLPYEEGERPRTNHPWLPGPLQKLREKTQADTAPLYCRDTAPADIDPARIIWVRRQCQVVPLRV
jgi:hypothetical protein